MAASTATGTTTMAAATSAMMAAATTMMTATAATVMVADGRTRMMGATRRAFSMPCPNRRRSGAVVSAA
jgi:hypothetical protein